MGAFFAYFCFGRFSIEKTINSEENNFRENTGCHMGQILLLRTQQAPKLIVCMSKETGGKNKSGFWELKLSTTWNDQ